VGVSSTPLQDFIAGLPRGAETGKTGGRIFVGDSHRDVSIQSSGAFLQDDWRVSPRLTLNVGVRYDLNTVIKEKNGRLANFDPATGIHQVGHGISAPYNGDHNNFAPRFGMSWDPCDILAVSKNLRTPYVINWNLNVQRALTSSTSLQVGYVGDHGVKLYGVRDINQVDPNSAAELDPACGHCEQAGRPFNSPYPYLEFINFLDNGYTSSYNSLQATLTQRTWKRMN